MHINTHSECTLLGFPRQGKEEEEEEEEKRL
jgi:hypothetical protein